MKAPPLVHPVICPRSSILFLPLLFHFLKSSKFVLHGLPSFLYTWLYACSYPYYLFEYSITFIFINMYSIQTFFPLLCFVLKCLWLLKISIRLELASKLTRWSTALSLKNTTSLIFISSCYSVLTDILNLVPWAPDLALAVDIFGIYRLFFWSNQRICVLTLVFTLKQIFSTKAFACT
mgnify:CR=1 FL=1